LRFGVCKHLWHISHVPLFFFLGGGVHVWHGYGGVTCRLQSFRRGDSFLYDSTSFRLKLLGANFVHRLCRYSWSMIVITLVKNQIWQWWFELIVSKVEGLCQHKLLLKRTSHFVSTSGFDKPLIILGFSFPCVLYLDFVKARKLHCGLILKESKKLVENIRYCMCWCNTTIVSNDKWT